MPRVWSTSPTRPASHRAYLVGHRGGSRPSGSAHRRSRSLGSGNRRGAKGDGDGGRADGGTGPDGIRQDHRLPRISCAGSADRRSRLRRGAPTSRGTAQGRSSMGFRAADDRGEEEQAREPGAHRHRTQCLRPDGRTALCCEVASRSSGRRTDHLGRTVVDRSPGLHDDLRAQSTGPTRRSVGRHRPPPTGHRSGDGDGWPSCRALALGRCQHRGRHSDVRRCLCR